MRKTGRIVPKEMTIRDRFDPVLTRPMPYGYALSPAMPDSIRTRTIDLLRLHGIAVTQLSQDWNGRVDVYKVESMQSGRYENFLTTRITGAWRSETRAIPRGTWVVSSAQPLAILATYLLEPESDDGIAGYTNFDPLLTAGSDFPVLRLMQAGIR
jgi:hypothetical protein